MHLKARNMEKRVVSLEWIMIQMWVKENDKKPLDLSWLETSDLQSPMVVFATTIRLSSSK